MNKKKIFGYNPNIFFVGLTSFAVDVSLKMLYSVMPIFLLSIGASKTAISLIEGIAESTASLIKVFSGRIADVIGKNKPLMLIGYSITALVIPFYVFVFSPLHVLLLRFIERIGKGIRTAPRDSLITGSSNEGEVGKSFGFHKAMDNSGAIIGPLLASFLLYIFPDSFDLVFLISSLPAIIGVVILLVYVKEAKSIKKHDVKSFKIRSLPARFYFFLVIVFIFGLGNSSDALLLVKTSESGVNKALIPFIYMIFNAVAVITAVPLGKLSDRIGHGWLIVLGFLIYSITYFMFGYFTDFRIFILLFVMYGLYSSMADTSQKSLLSNMVSGELKGTGFGIYHGLIGLTALPASLVAGYFYDKTGGQIPFYFGGAMALIAAILMIWFNLKYSKPKR